MKIEEMRKILDSQDDETSNARGVDTRKFSGVINWTIDPVAYQRKIRGEWEREIKSS